MPGALDAALVGRQIEAVERHGRFVHMRISGLDLVISPMLAGRFEIAEAGSRAGKDLERILRRVLSGLS